ncbi:hypothetical protein E2C01_056490 [Portunus trituberculatus]|uniref:Uncharacterized protein n=1 Tax=Portunus trituberculatus TaxID=210409 RepID=A0A5B7GYC0_PORTR|nr:hypothetical protein [Portunus trituberculatus]
MGPSVAAANRQRCILLKTRKLPMVARKEHKFIYNNIVLYESGNTGHAQYGPNTASGRTHAPLAISLPSLTGPPVLHSQSSYTVYSHTPDCNYTS